MSILHLWLSLASPSPVDVAEARAFEKEAHALQQEGRYAEAEKPLLDAIAAWKRILGPGGIDILNDEINLAVSYRRRGEPTRAVPILELVAADLKASKDPDAPGLYRSALNNLAAAYRDVGRRTDARNTLRTVADMLERAGPSEEHARVLDNLADVLTEEGDLANAEMYARRALAEWKKLRGEDNADVGVSLAVLGHLLMERGKLGEARPLLEHAVQLTEKARGKEHPELAAALNLLGTLEVRDHHLDTAQRLFERALGICRGRLPDTHPIVQDALGGLAEVARGREAKP